MPDFGGDALVSTEWLADHLNDPRVRIIDASYFVPGGIEKARQLYAESHIPGAVFFDINVFADSSKPKDHAFPTAAIFAAQAGKLGIANHDQVIAYDRLGGTCAAARAWFMFRAFGHEEVRVLDGGHSKWEAESRPLTSEVPSPAECAFDACSLPGRVYDKHDVLANLQRHRYQLLDARSKGRFEGSEPEPRPGLRSGHIPGSHNLPFLALINGVSKTWKDPAAINAAFAAAGIDLSKPLTTTCGSGVSACALALGAHLAGKTDTAIYDGSWIEWGADTGLPIEAGG